MKSDHPCSPQFHRDTNGIYLCL
uniref:Uncharacterized protein n=1 Tax=Rhizophora mucronata TaxID=61149 RepID=A0A2P2PFT2_RHIMU